VIKILLPLGELFFRWVGLHYQGRLVIFWLSRAGTLDAIFPTFCYINSIYAGQRLNVGVFCCMQTEARLPNKKSTTVLQVVDWNRSTRRLVWLAQAPRKQGGSKSL